MISQSETHQPMAAQPAPAERAMSDVRARFKRHFSTLILEEALDARGQTRFLYPHVESMFAGWSAAHAQLSGETRGGARDSERLNFLIRHGACVIWSADRRCCAVFRYAEGHMLEPMAAQDGGWPTARQAIDAAQDAIETETNARQGEGVSV